MRRRVVLLAGLLSGCKMIDQRTFNPDAGRAPFVPPLPPLAAAPPPTPVGPQPLVAIPLDPPTEYDAPLHDAIAAAFARARRIFEVRAVVSSTASAEATQTAADAAGRVARAIVAQGGRVTVTAQVGAPDARPTVLVFVR